ncbi:MAG TPA: SLC13 family permease, partial [Prolixibacteraceae bacterium]|nr:SLC13 family permease [Prolixibacteraceae bacterium]
MSVSFLLFAVLSAIALLLFLVLRWKISAFISLLIVSIYVGILCGMPLNSILDSMQKGMGGTLGFVATVVGLGAIFGQMLESSGGALSLAHTLIRKFGARRAPTAMAITGFLVAIPVFFDVGFIILIPLVYAMSRDTGKSLLYYGIPLLAGLAVTHSFIPPTPGPVAVAEIIQAQLGWVILFGFILGIPVAFLAGPVWGKYIARRIKIPAPDESNPEAYNEGESPSSLPSFRLIAILIGLPLMLIVLNTFTKVLTDKMIVKQTPITDIVRFLGHPFTALIIATLAAIWLLG